jgi:hypothetical protein
VVFDSGFLEPEYAIGQRLISRDEFNHFRNTYLAQSELSLGLILPLLLIVFAVTIRQSNLSGWEMCWISTSIVIATCVLFVLAMERHQKYLIELKLLLVGRWEKQGVDGKVIAKQKAGEAASEG